jgi:hypothetical protein
MADFTPASVIATLSDIVREKAVKTAEVAALDRMAIQARHAHKNAHNQALESAQGAADIRRAHAELASADLSLQADLAESAVREARDWLRVLDARLDVGRSIGSLIKLEFNG